MYLSVETREYSDVVILDATHAGGFYNLKFCYVNMASYTEHIPL